MIIELEKTYLAKYLPEDLILAKNEEYLDTYIPSVSEHPVLRIRKRGFNYEITKKYPVSENDSSKQHEFTIPLTKEEFDELDVNLLGKRSRKQRYFYNFLDQIAEIDIFKDELEGLVLVDIEFSSEEDKEKFIPPDFCLIEITQESTFAGGRLVGKKYADFEPILVKYSYKPLFLNISL